MLKVGVIGAGHMGRTHAEVFRHIEDVKFMGVADISEKAGRALAEQHQAKYVPTLDDLLNLGVEVVYITTPNATHLEAALQALRAGVHVFSEKPIATSLPDATRLLDAARAAQGLYQLGHCRRFSPVYKRVKDILSQGAFVPLAAHLKMNSGEMLNPPWAGDPVLTGGVLYENTMHYLDLVRWLFGEVKRVLAVTRQSVYHMADSFSMLFEFYSGVHCTIASCAHASWIYPFEAIELYGKHSAIVTEELERVRYAPDLSQPITEWHFSQVPFIEKWGYLEEDRLFFQAIQEGGKPVVSALDGYRAVQIADACYRSKGEWVTITL
ncbi:MAG: Gfo/Idh/MocA family oxidoreductase [Deinococcus sp.]|nr:Gfo/Idh/MocA family oxidoreductase [Deinococcus sp.]